MSEAPIEREPSVAYFVIQQLAVPLIPWILPQAWRLGKLVWVIPAAALLPVFVFAAISDPDNALRDFFHPGPNGEAGWGAVLLTEPACYSVAYCLGLMIGAKRRGACSQRAASPLTGTQDR